MTLRMMVIDDTATFRKILGDVLKEIPGVEVVGFAHNGKMALERIERLQPDLVTLDIEMPEMNGLEVLEALRNGGIKTSVIVVSAFTRLGSEMTIRALELGAFDFITKQTQGDFSQNRAEIQKKLLPIIQAFKQRWEVQSILSGAEKPATVSTRSQEKSPSIASYKTPGTGRHELVLIGVSTGGPHALAQVLPALPADLGLPLLIVQHMPPLFTRSLAESLDKKCALKVKEAEHGESALPNTVYIAPGGKHMKVALDMNGKPGIVISDDPPENNCKPSADTLFRSAAHHFAGKICSVIMTGMGRDGTLGLRLIKRHPAWVIAQDEASSAVFGMPKEAIAAGVVDEIVPLNRIAGAIQKSVLGITLP